LWLALASVPPLSMHSPDPPAPPKLSWVRFVPVPLGPKGETRAGGLAFLGGWEMTSNDGRFGGISAMHVGAGGVLALSDSGFAFRFALPGAQRVRLEVLPLVEGAGSGAPKSSGDAESMAVEGGRFWVGFERQNALARYRLSDLRPVTLAQPPSMRGWRSNRGAEAMLRLPDGRFLVFSEGKKNDRPSEVLLFRSDPALAFARSVKLSYRPPPGYRVTDAALLPDGRALFLNRRFSLPMTFSVKVTVASLAALEAGAMIEGEEVATLEAPLAADNFEALAVTRGGGRTILWIASDDNYNRLQRSLLLKFAL
jgi:hypothetical protein